MKFNFLMNKLKEKQIGWSKVDKDLPGYIEYNLHVPDNTSPIKHINYTYEEVRVKKGRIVLQIEEEIYELVAGESILITTGSTQQWRYASSDKETDCILTFRSLGEDGLFGNLLKHKRAQKKLIGQAIKIAPKSSNYEVSVNAEKVSTHTIILFMKTCRKYLQEFTQSILPKYSSPPKIIADKA